MLKKNEGIQWLFIEETKTEVKIIFKPEIVRTKHKISLNCFKKPEMKICLLNMLMESIKDGKESIFM